MRTEWTYEYTTRTRIYTIKGYFGSSILEYKWRKKYIKQSEVA